MHTPTHAALNFLALGRVRGVPRGWILLGAVLPDLPMLAFFLFEAAVRGEPMERIFDTLYFEPRWQTVFDAFHSIPIFLLLGACFLWRRNRIGELFTASLLLHSLVDWPTHLEDAHAYFWPILRGPLPGVVSYWYPRSWFWVLEIAIVAAALWAWLCERLSALARRPARA